MIDLKARERKRSSQNGEDGVIVALLAGYVEPYSYPTVAAEIGWHPGENNTNWLRDAHEWTVYAFDAAQHDSNDYSRVKLTAKNIAACFRANNVPLVLGLLSIDVDGQDLYLLRSLLNGGYCPAIIVCEYNAALGPHTSITVPEDADWAWDGTDHFGASLKALSRTAVYCGYQLVYCESSGTNAFFVNRKILGPEDFEHPDRAAERLWVPPGYTPHVRSAPGRNWVRIG